MLFSESTIAVLLAKFAHLSLAVAEIAEASVKVTGGGSRGRVVEERGPPAPKKTKTKHRPRIQRRQAGFRP